MRSMGTTVAHTDDRHPLGPVMQKGKLMCLCVQMKQTGHQARNSKSQPLSVDTVGQPCSEASQVSSFVQLDVGISANSMQAKPVWQHLSQEQQVFLHLPCTSGLWV